MNCRWFHSTHTSFKLGYITSSRGPGLDLYQLYAHNLGEDNSTVIR